MLNKRIWIAGALSIAGIFFIVWIQNNFIAPPNRTSQTEKPPVEESREKAPESAPVSLIPDSGGPVSEKEIVVETDVFRITFTNKGGAVRSLELKQYLNNDGSYVDLVLPDKSQEYPFCIRFGNYLGNPVDALFHARKTVNGNPGIEFFRNFILPDRNPVTLIKRYIFLPEEYIFKLEIEFTAPPGTPLLYAVEIGPQLGPDFIRLNGRTEYRYYSYITPEKKRTLSTKGSEIRIFSDLDAWGGVQGKYFALTAIPGEKIFDFVIDPREIPEVRNSTVFFLNRNTEAEGNLKDTLYFYAGPKRKEILSRYEDFSRSNFNLENSRLSQLIPAPRLITRFSLILKELLELFYRIIPNYGIAIILTALVIRLILAPLSGRQYEYQHKLRELQGKIKEIQEKYSHNQEQLNQEIRHLYEKINIRASVRIWPVLIQLPLIMLGVMVLQSRYIQPPDPEARSQKMMSIIFPLLIFLILYNLPSGLVLYWTMYTLFGIIHYVIFNTRYQNAHQNKA